MTLATFELPRGVDVATTLVFPDEPCFYLGETDRISESGKTKHRYQILKVVRNDRLVTACLYLGPSDLFQCGQFQLVGGSVDDAGRGYAVHTVAELQEGAEELRTRPLLTNQPPTDLDAAYKLFVEERIKRQKHQSTFGPAITIARN